MRARTKTVITFETWERTTVRISRETVSTGEPVIDRHESSQDIHRIVAPADDELPIGAGIAGKEKLE